MTDFGITKASTERTPLTETGAFVGTVEYCAPEVIRGDVLDGRADVYSLGCVLFECLTGEKPFSRDSDLAVDLRPSRGRRRRCLATAVPTCPRRWTPSWRGRWPRIATSASRAPASWPTRRSRRSGCGPTAPPARRRRAGARARRRSANAYRAARARAGRRAARAGRPAVAIAAAVSGGGDRAGRDVAAGDTAARRDRRGDGRARSPRPRRARADRSSAATWPRRPARRATAAAGARAPPRAPSCS